MATWRFRAGVANFILASNPSPHHFDPSARPSWRGPGKTAGHLGNCKVDGSVRSQFSPFFTLTVARVPCYEMSRAYITNLLLVLATRSVWEIPRSGYTHVTGRRRMSAVVFACRLEGLRLGHTFGSMRAWQPKCGCSETDLLLAETFI